MNCSIAAPRTMRRKSGDRRTSCQMGVRASAFAFMSLPRPRDPAMAASRACAQQRQPCSSSRLSWQPIFSGPEASRKHVAVRANWLFLTSQRCLLAVSPSPGREVMRLSQSRTLASSFPLSAIPTLLSDAERQPQGRDARPSAWLLQAGSGIPQTPLSRMCGLAMNVTAALAQARDRRQIQVADRRLIDRARRNSAADRVRIHGRGNRSSRGPWAPRNAVRDRRPASARASARNRQE